MADDRDMSISVWSDYVCPFCYLELPVLDRLLEAYGDKIRVDWKAFELRPEPEPTLDPDGPYLHRVWNQSVYPMAEERGVTLRLPPVQPRSRKAFEAAEFARTQGRFDAMHRALFRGFFEEGRDLGDESVLLELGRSVGLEEAALADARRKGRFTPKVVRDQELARRLGLTGVPALVILPADQAEGMPLVVSGAQPYDVVSSAVEWVLGRKR